LVYYTIFGLLLNMKTQEIRQYLRDTMGIEIHGLTYSMAGRSKRLPFHLGSTYEIQEVTILDRPLLLAILKNYELPQVSQLKTQFENLKQEFGKTPVLVAEQIPTAIIQKLTSQGINFIVPGKQVYLPAVLVTLESTWSKPKPRASKLLPSAQVLLLYKLLHPYNSEIEELTFKELAKKFRYSAMGITKAVNNLQQLDLCEVEGTKEKTLSFKSFASNHELWHEAEPYLLNPVQNRVYIDELPKKVFLLRAATSALPEYTSMNPDKIQYYAIENYLYRNLLSQDKFKNPNFYEGPVCLEIWRYNPQVLTNSVDHGDSVDPLSLYLSLRDEQDERIEIALEEILDKHIF